LYQSSYKISINRRWCWEWG